MSWLSDTWHRISGEVGREGNQIKDAMPNWMPEWAKTDVSAGLNPGKALVGGEIGSVYQQNRQAGDTKKGAFEETGRSGLRALAAFFGGSAIGGAMGGSGGTTGMFANMFGTGAGGAAGGEGGFTLGNSTYDASGNLVGDTTQLSGSEASTSFSDIFKNVNRLNSVSKMFSGGQQGGGGAAPANGGVGNMGDFQRGYASFQPAAAAAMDFQKRQQMDDLNILGKQMQVAGEQKQVQDNQILSQKVNALTQTDDYIKATTAEKQRKVADLLMESGHYDEAVKFNDKAELMEKRQTDEDVKRAKDERDKMMHVGGVAQAITADPNQDQATGQSLLDNARAVMRAEGVDPDKMGMPREYSPKTLPLIRQAAANMMSAKDAMHAAYEGKQAVTAAKRAETASVKEQRQARQAQQASAPAVVDEGKVAQIADGEPLTQVIPGYGKEAVKERDAHATAAIDSIMADNPGMTRKDAGKELARRANEYKASGAAAKVVATAEPKAVSASLTQVTKDLSALEPYKQMLDKNASIASRLADKAIATNSKWANKSLNWLRQNAGDNPALADYLFQINTVSTEAARVLNNPRLVGQLTDSAVHEMRQLIDGDMPLNATKAVLARMKSDGSNRLGAMKDKQKQLEGQLHGMDTKPQSSKMPAGIPDGSKLIGHTPEGKEVWEGADGKKRVP